MTCQVTLTKRFGPAVIWLTAVWLIASCSADSGQDEGAGYNERSRGCLECHVATFDTAHRLDCEICHLPAENAKEGDDHPSIVTMPAHPDHSNRTCGQCHEQQAAMVHDSDHYLLRGHVETIRSAFVKGDGPADPAEAPRFPVSSRQSPETEAELAEDLLSRRCLRCHVYASGDPFPSVLHGTGCASCHLAFVDAAMVSHEFIARPEDNRCLSCHYGSHVGFDYYGRYEHDLNEEYRTPYSVNSDQAPPFGVEYHLLAPDVHQLAGMACIDCHRREDVMGAGAPPACRDCHDYREEHPVELSLMRTGGETLFTSAFTGNTLTVPQLSHEAHDRFGDRFSCQVCHAQWSFNDGSVHLLRIDHEEFDNFHKLSVDGSWEVHQIIDSHVSIDGELLEPFMTDKFSGEPLPGIWIRGFVERRWERLELIEDDDGKIYVARPILDLYLSWIDEYEQVRFDNVRPALPGLRRYAPHTIGKAGLFYRQRIVPFLDR